MMTDPTGDGAAHSATRRGILKAAGAASAGAAAATLLSTGAVAEPAAPEPTPAVPDPENVQDYNAFPQSVGSGGPTPDGAIVWTRVDEELARFTDGTLFLELVDGGEAGETANGAVDFSSPDHQFRVPDGVPADQDHTVRVDLDPVGLESDRFYFYRFVYDAADAAVASPVGRLHTMPGPDASVDDLGLVVTSCNNYQHGYFGGFAQAAEEPADFHVSLGDFLYEYAGAGNQPGRDIELPSGNDIIHTLADFRHQHQVYRGDQHLQAMMERHTLIHTWDDHEVVNNRWWNYEGDYPDTTSHPSYSGNPQQMRELYAHGIKSMLEYLPLRVEYDDPGEDYGEDNTAQDYFRLYRSFRFGDLAELFMTDERLYRDRPPEGPDGERRDAAAPPSRSQDDLDRSMLGTQQYRWFLDGGSNPGPMPDTEGVTGTDAAWKLHGNEVLSAALKTANAGPASLYLNYDAWDGYEAERNLIMSRFARDEVDNFITLTGDMHTYVAGYLKQDYKDPKQSELAGGPRTGIEFMTPGISSDNLGAAGGLPADMTEDAIDEAIQAGNPHIEWFNSSRWGYTVIEISSTGLTYTAYDVDRSVDSADAPKQLLRSYRVPEGRYELQEFRSPPLNETVGEQVDASFADSTTATDGPDIEADPEDAPGTIEETVEGATGGGDGGSGGDRDDDSTESDPVETGTSTTTTDGDGNGIPDPVEDAFDSGI
jgi:alkaline phosphatase D